MNTAHTPAAPKLFAYQMEAGMSILVNGSEAVTVAKIDRNDSSAIVNGVVYFTATNGRKYGLNRYDDLRFA